MAKQALGKGLGALIGRVDKKNEDDVVASPANSDPEPGDRVISANLSEVVPSPLQPRKHFTDDALDELVESIREHGVIQPLIVRRVGEKLELIAGERRWRACQKVGVATVPVIEREASDRDVLEMALIENLQREDLNPIEEADAYVRLARDFGMTQEEIAGRVGKNRATVANSMRLLDLSAEAREHLIGGRISIGHAKVLLAIKAEEEQTLIAAQVVKRGLTVRATEKLVNEHLNPEKERVVKPGRSNQLSAALSEVQEQLRERLATQVQIHHGTKKGRIEIEYYSNEDLARLLDLMGVS